MISQEKKHTVHRKFTGQAAIELAVFGAILIFILGTIIRTAISNSYQQNQSFKAMRMAMLASWNGSKQNPVNIARNSASVLFIEDRLSPDFNKYGALDRNPYIVQGSGSFSYQLLYPLTVNEDDIQANMPVMDVYINGQHFPFTTAGYVENKTIYPPASCTYPANSCLQNQCLRNMQEWVSQTNGSASGITPAQLSSIVPTNKGSIAQSNGGTIYNELLAQGYIDGNGTAQITTLPASFISWFKTNFPGTGQNQINQIQSLLKANTKKRYKLFFTHIPRGSNEFTLNPPSCSASPVKDKSLCGSMSINGVSNSSGDLMFNLNRVYTSNNEIEGRYTQQCGSSPLAVENRCNVAWEWVATPGTTENMIGFNKGTQQYPSYDIDGRLKEVTIYGISQDSSGDPVVSYEDSQLGDIDGQWDTTSCTPKPGLQEDSQIYTFTKEGTFLQIKEGKLYNPETGQWVRSTNARNSIDLIQRRIVLSNNTGRFCTQGTPSAICPAGSTVNGVPCADSNPVEVCVDGSTSRSNCFTEDTIKQTCYDTSSNVIFVRSRLEDRRGRNWFTNANGDLKVL